MNLRYLAACSIVSFAFSVSSVAADSDRWLDAPFPYTVVDQDVHDVLGELGRNVKIDVHVSDAVKGRVRGGWRVDTVGSFLDRLTSDVGIEWFFDGHRLNVSSAEESVRRVLPLDGVEAKAWQTSIKQMGIESDQFPVVIDEDRGVALVSGPPQYVQLVEQSLPKKKAKSTGRVNIIYGRKSSGDAS